MCWMLWRISCVLDFVWRLASSMASSLFQDMYGMNNAGAAGPGGAPTPGHPMMEGRIGKIEPQVCHTTSVCCQSQSVVHGCWMFSGGLLWIIYFVVCWWFIQIVPSIWRLDVTATVLSRLSLLALKSLYFLCATVVPDLFLVMLRIVSYL